MYARTLRITLATLTVLAGASIASAQVDPEGGDVWVPPPDDTGATDTQTQQQPPPQQQPWYQGGPTGQAPAEAPPPVQHEEAPPAQSQPADGRSDHARVVGHLGFGYMGIANVPIGGLSTPDANDTITAPALGVRFWISELLGLDVGIGLGFLGGTTDTGPDSIPVNNAFALTIHAGVPLAIFHAQHYKLLIIPEANLGFATGTLFHPTDSDFDRSRSGLLFQLGGRLGGEIHFGFMNIPQLSLQAGVGLYFQYASASVGAPDAGDPDDDSVGAESISLASTVLGEPWQILVGSLNAIYYF